MLAAGVGANTVMSCAVMVGLVASLQSHHHHHGGVVEAEGGPLVLAVDSPLEVG